ncbi:PREDICTED: probable guanine nucleotide exchange factor MCF2L2 [Chrysochloris asiatica]|uniref:Probable guanine nucleotide exchange factor MCF2L2 n=1 Tax=Chrysochloris asiatica TaxID=185453 RepID=A0A9B0U062_CHRAS|nr:PREDICTED: probable guanine nucleotide exchange factor MCF2L2 [Chrysochloris asiatica]
MLFWLKEEMGPQELTRRLATVITHVDEIMQQEIRPMVAVDIIEQLHRQFAILSGGHGRDGAPIITFPEFAGFKHIPNEDFLNVMTYLTSIPSVEAANIGFIIVIDRRRDKWSSIKASLTRIAVAFPGNLQLIFILRPSRFIQRAFTDIGIKYYRDEFKMKVPIIMLNSASDLHGYIDKSQLTQELGGTLEYRHKQWINHRTAIENFALTVKTTAHMLQMFGVCLSETELPRGMQPAEELLMAHTRQQDQLKDQLKILRKQGSTLMSCIQKPGTKNPTRSCNPNELENVATMGRLLVQLDETEKAFSRFWSEHQLKLNQCLQLQHFEHNFCEVKHALDHLLEEQTELTDIGDSVMRVEQLLKELKMLEERGQESLEKARLCALIGDQLIQSHHYAADTIRPKCVELRHLRDDFINENKKKWDILRKSLELHRQLDKVSQWCEAGIYLLASQAVDKCQSREGVDIAMNDIKTFLSTAQEYQLPNLKEFYNQFELILTLDIKDNAQKVLQKLGNVQEIFDKRQVSLKKLAAKQTRPVQPVAPHPESSPKWVPPKTGQISVLFIPLAPPQKISEELLAETDLNFLEKEGDETKFEIKNEEIVESSQEMENLEREPCDSLEHLSPSRIPGARTNLLPLGGGSAWVKAARRPRRQAGANKDAPGREPGRTFKRRATFTLRRAGSQQLPNAGPRALWDLLQLSLTDPNTHSNLTSWGYTREPVHFHPLQTASPPNPTKISPVQRRQARLTEQPAEKARLCDAGRIIRELLETEEIYIKEINSIIDGYIVPMDFIWLRHLIPDVLQNNKDFLFGNIRELHEFHNRTFLKELEKCTENPELLPRCFLKRKEDLQIYFKYHKNLPRARAIWQECQDCAYFGVCQRQLEHNLPLFKYLREPSQRLIKYQMLLKDGPKRTKDSAFSSELQQALVMVEDLIKSCELAVDLAAVTGCPDDIGKLGKLLMQGPFNIWTIHKDRYKMKDLMRFKPSQRQIYLFERGIVFCKIRVEPSDQGFSPHFSFKKSMKLMTLSISQVGRGSNKKFEIASRNGLEKYIVQAASKEIRDCWFSEINRLLMEQQNNITGNSNKTTIIGFNLYNDKIGKAMADFCFERLILCEIEYNSPEGIKQEYFKNMQRVSSSQEYAALSTCSIQGSSNRELIAMETVEECEGAETLEKDSSALSLSGLFLLDDSYETCSSKSFLETGESKQGEKDELVEKERAANRAEEGAGMSTGLLIPKDA